MQHVDLAIIGGGIAGASLAYFMAGHATIRLLEMENAPGYHATGRSAAEFVLRYNAPAVTALARLARPFFDAPPAGFADVPLLHRRGSLIVASAETLPQLKESFDRDSADGAALDWLSPEAALAAVPFLSRDWLAGAYFDPDFFDIDVDALLQGYLRGARAAGVTIETGSAFVSAHHDGTSWQVETTTGAFAATRLVNAAGGWASDVARRAGVAPVTITPHRRTAVLVDLPPEIEARLLPEVNEISDAFYFKPDGGRLFVSPADETPCEAGDVQPEELDIAWAMHHLTEATVLRPKRVAQSWAGMRSFSPDRLPVIGPAPDQPAFFWLAGQGGYGILTSPALGRIAAGQLRTGVIPDDALAEGLSLETFSAARFA